jgi:hypothetical protein
MNPYGMKGRPMLDEVKKCINITIFILNHEEHEGHEAEIIIFSSS